VGTELALEQLEIEAKRVGVPDEVMELEGEDFEEDAVNEPCFERGGYTTE
jgi:hypothetical protein